MKATNQAFQKIANLALVLRTLWQNPGLTRNEIAKKLDLEKSTVVYIITRLLDNNIVIPVDKAKSPPQGGRQPERLALNENYGCVIGLEIQTYNYEMVILSLTGEIIRAEKHNYNFITGELDEHFIQVVQQIEKSIQDITIPVLGIGVGMPGLIHPNTGKIIVSHPLGLREYDFIKKIESRFNIPFFVENDANCCAWGELLFNKRKALKDFIYLLAEFQEKNTKTGMMAGMGIGLGIVFEGKVYYGHNNSAGEFKSVFWQKKYKGQVGIDDENMANIKNDREVLKKFVNELLMNFSLLISIHNPSHVFIGGDLTEYKDIVDDCINNNLNEYYINSDDNDCQIVFSELGENDVALGAASMFLEKLFAVPQLSEIESYSTVYWDDLFNRMNNYNNQILK